MLVLHIIAMIDRNNLSFAALQLNEDLGFSKSVYGFAAGISFLRYALFETPSNLIVARCWGRTEHCARVTDSPRMRVG